MILNGKEFSPFYLIFWSQFQKLYVNWVKWFAYTEHFLFCLAAYIVVMIGFDIVLHYEGILLFVTFQVGCHSNNNSFDSNSHGSNSN